MSELSGDLTSFELRRVLELLADTKKTGELQISTDDLEGRILFQDGAVGYATTATGADSVRELDALLSRHRADMSDHPSAEGSSDHSSYGLDEVLQEQLTEVFCQLGLVEAGLFEFTTSSSGPDDVPTFAVDDMLRRVDTRIEEWRKIREVIPSTATRYRMAARLRQSSEVTIDSRTWELLATVGIGGSVADAAESLQRHAFQAARGFAQLVDRGLLEPVGEAPPSTYDGVVTELSPDSFETEPDDEVIEAPIPRIQPTEEAVTFSQGDLSREEKDDLIRNIGRGIYPD